MMENHDRFKNTIYQLWSGGSYLLVDSPIAYSGQARAGAKVRSQELILGLPCWGAELQLLRTFVAASLGLC